jgi:PKD repeat protein
MKKLLLLLLFISSHFLVSIAQCPDAQFNASGPVCAGVAINFNNTSTGATSYSWDFCAGDFDTLITDTSEVSGFLNTPSGLTTVTDTSGNYVFVCSRGNDKVIRYDYHNGFNNAPTLITDLGNMLGLVSSPNGIAFHKEGSIWYALVLSIFNNTVTKFDFTNGLDSLPTAGAVIVSSSLNFPRGLDIVTDNSGNVVCVVSNFIGNTLTAIDFGNSINNVPVVGTPYAIGGSGAIDVDLVKECDNWYALVSCYTSNDVYLVDYGTSLTGTPISNVALYASLSNPTGVSVVRDNNTWYSLTSNSLSGKISVQNIGSTLTLPAVSLVGDVVFGGGTPAGINMVKDGTDWYGYVTLESSNALKQINFRNPCSASSATSTDPSPSGIIFNTGGSHFVELEATNNSGNSDFYSLDVPVFISPMSNFSVSGHCLGEQSIFLDSTTLASGTITSWHWEFGNGDTTNIQSPTYTYSDTGAFTVTLTTVASNGCSNEYSIPFEISVVPVADFSTQSGCSETALTFTDLSTISAGTISDWFWQFGSGDTSVQSNPVYSYATGGNYLVSLTVTSAKGCSHSNSKNLPVIDRPIGNFLAQNTCVGQTVQFIDQSSVSGTTITDYLWDFGDSNISSNQNPSHLYAGAVNVFPVRLIITAANGCIDTVDQDIKINNIPVANFSFTPTVVCQNSDVQFSDLSFVSGDTISSWAWDFGDGLTDSVMNPIHQFATPGMKTISLIAYSPTKCPSAITQQAVNIIESPTALFSFTDVCLGATTQFTDLSTAPTGSMIVTRTWDFGGGDTSTLTNPSYTYSMPGTFPVQFTVITDAGCSNSITNNVPVHDLPVASFTSSNPCSNQLTNFTNTSSADSLSIISTYEWNFGDFGSGSANFSSLPDPTHTFSAANIYNVFLIATTNYSCKDTSQVAIRIYPSAPAQFTYSPTCYGDLMEFFNPGSSIDSAYRWSFGDSQSNQLKEPAHFYAFPGNYTVTLTVYAIGGCATTATKQVSVSPIPTANFVSAPACIDAPFSFIENSTIASGSIVGWEWSLANEGVIDSVQNPIYTFTDTGAFTVSLKVTSDIGCQNTISKTIRSHELPVANFSFNPQFGNPPLDVQFTDFSQGANQYVWDFGDGQSGSTLQQPSHIYQDTGLYVIQQKVISAFGCLDSTTKNIYVIKPILDIAITGDSSYISGNYFHLVARIANLGTREIDSVSIEGRLADGTNVLEKYISLIPNGPAGIQWYRFHATFLISASTKLDYYCIKVSEPNGEADDVPANNEKCFSRIKELAVINPYPNPFTSKLIVRVILPFEDILKLEIIDQLGKTMLSIPEKITSKGLTEFNLNLAEIPDGVYSVMLQFRDERVVKQVIKNSLTK